LGITAEEIDKAIRGHIQPFHTDPSPVAAGSSAWGFHATDALHRFMLVLILVAVVVVLPLRLSRETETEDIAGSIPVTIGPSAKSPFEERAEGLDTCLMAECPTLDKLCT
jgi:hypothetical protein